MQANLLDIFGNLSVACLYDVVFGYVYGEAWVGKGLNGVFLASHPIWFEYATDSGRASFFAVM